MMLISCIKWRLKRLKLFTAFSFALVCEENFIKAQTIADAGIWATVNFELDINPNTIFFLTEEIRTKGAFRRLDLLYTKIGIEHKINKHFKTSLGYKFKQKLTSEGFFSFRHRLEWDISARKKIRDFNFSYRHRLQAEVSDFYSSESGRFPEWFSRNKFQIKYDLNKKLTSYVSTELKYQIYSPMDHQSDNFFINARHQLGFDYKLNTNHTIGMYYLINDEFNIKNPEDMHVIGLEWNIPLTKNKDVKNLPKN